MRAVQVCAVLVFLVWMQLSCDKTVRNSPAHTQPDNLSPSTSQSAKPSRQLPKGFVPVEGTQLAPDGWPKEIRCLKDDSIMVFVPGGQFVSGLTSKQFKTLAHMQLDFSNPDWDKVEEPGESLDDLLKNVKPGKLVKKEDLKDANRLSKSQKAAIAFLGALQDTGGNVPADQLDKWRSGGRTFSGLMLLPGVQKHLGPVPNMKPEAYEKLVDQIFATPREHQQQRLLEQISELRQFIRSARRGSVGSFYIDKYEITNRQYRRFYKQANDRKRRPGLWYGPTYNIGGPKNPKFYDLWKDPKRNADDQPVTCVGKKDVLDYAKWAGKRLPTRDEWERAAIGDGGRLFPWGSDFRVGYCCCDIKPLPKPTTQPGRTTIGGILRTAWQLRRELRKLREGAIPAKVGRFPHDASSFACRDLGGNVSEWVILPEQSTLAKPALTPIGGNAGSFSLWNICPAMIESYTEAGKLVGFRTILSVEPPKR